MNTLRIVSLTVYSLRCLIRHGSKAVWPSNTLTLALTGRISGKFVLDLCGNPVRLFSEGYLAFIDCQSHGEPVKERKKSLVGWVNWGFLFSKRI